MISDELKDLRGSVPAFGRAYVNESDQLSLHMGDSMNCFLHNVNELGLAKIEDRDAKIKRTVASLD